MWDQLDHREIQDFRAFKEILGQLVLKAIQAFKGMWDQLDLLADQLGLKVMWDQLGRREMWDQLGLKEIQAFKGM
jgi:hypothetical protein